MKRFKKIVILVLVISLTAALFVGCSEKSRIGVNTPPTTVTVWTYYNGNAKEAFDKSVTEFNSTIGSEENIVIDAYSQGDVTELADAVLRAAKGNVGAKKMPHMFATYSDSAFTIDEMGLLADLDKYFTKEELSDFRDEFIEDGRFGDDNKLKIMPIAKSTENLFINTTDFNKFAQDTGAKLEDLNTWEGIRETAEKYYNWSGGKAFFGIDAMANFMIVSCMQLGTDFYAYDSDKLYNFSKETAKKIWDNFYVPYAKGYYAKIGRFRSDDAKTGDILAYVGSTAGASYFPKQIEKGIDNLYPIESAVLQYPKYRDGELVVIQQGAGMALAKSDKEHEEAAVKFLKWFTENQQNLKFSVATGYFSVKNKVMNIAAFERNAKENNLKMETTSLKSANATFKMLETAKLYTNKPLDCSYDLRKVLEQSLTNYAENDSEKLDTEENFNNWYSNIIDELNKVTSK